MFFEYVEESTLRAFIITCFLNQDIVNEGAKLLSVLLAGTRSKFEGVEILEELRCSSSESISVPLKMKFSIFIFTLVFSVEMGTFFIRLVVPWVSSLMGE